MTNAPLEVQRLHQLRDAASSQCSIAMLYGNLPIHIDIAISHYHFVAISHTDYLTVRCVFREGAATSRACMTLPIPALTKGNVWILDHNLNDHDTDMKAGSLAMQRFIDPIWR